ncbi:MAG: hypothetical protein HC828_19435, partial [Blastochloris sp.]|nr:hypothetical protein [Blastochloris sp.]
LVGWGLFGVVVLRWWQAGPAWRNLLWLAGVVFVAAWLTVMIWDKGFLSPLLEEQIRARVDATVATDTLFHMAISSMIQTYGIPSTGLDGLPYLNYHIGSHWVFAMLANVLDTTPLTSYLLAYPVIFIPLFLLALLSLAIDVRFTLAPHAYDAAPEQGQPGQPMQPGPPMRSDGLFWALLVVALVMPFGLREGIYIGVASYLISESYNLSLTLTLLLASVGLAFSRSQRASGQHPPHEVLAFVLLLLLGVGALGMVKVSLLVLVVLVLLWLFVRLRLYTSFVFLVALPLLLSVSLVVMYLVSYPSLEASAITPFHYINNFVEPEWQGTFFFAGFLFAWLLLLLKGAALRIATRRRLLAAWQSHRLLDVEVVLILAVVGALPALLLPIPGGSALFFWDVQRWVALALLLGQLDLAYGLLPQPAPPCQTRAQRAFACAGIAAARCAKSPRSWQAGCCAARGSLLLPAAGAGRSADYGGDLSAKYRRPRCDTG